MSDQLTTDQVKDAIAQMESHCRLSMDKYREGVGEYEMLCAREVLSTLGFHGDDRDQVLQALYDGGFQNCLDPDYHNYRDGQRRISLSVCYWGADQLESRLRSVWIR